VEHTQDYIKCWTENVVVIDSSGETCVFGRIILKRMFKKYARVKLDSTVQNRKDCRTIVTL
jgi:hypothetical protein